MKTIVSVISVMCLVSCHKPKACIYTDSTTVNVNQEIIFSNCSENTHYGMWDFGDGTEGIDDHLEIKHAYKQPGTYQVKLKAHAYEDRKKVDTKTIEMVVQ